MDPLEIIARYYTPGSDLYNLLVIHSRQVAELSMVLSHRAQERGLHIDIEFVREAAMLHDIGIFATHAPGIYCMGDEPYIRHGVIGHDLLMEQGLARHALVCERHTGTGLSAEEILREDLPLPHRNMLPVSLEEKVICYADNFYSKSRIAPAKSLDLVERQLSKFGQGTIERLHALIELFGEPPYQEIDREIPTA